MASNINYEDIDQSFPKTGVDNPSQGFRDNFSVIKDSLQTAKEEITNLQSTTAKINDENDFNGNLIKQAKFVNCVQESFTRTTPSNTDQIVDYVNGNYQEFRLDKNTNFVLQGWPQSDGYASLRIGLFSTTDVSHVATFRVNGSGAISYDQETTYTEVGQSDGQSVQVVTRGMSSSQLIGPDIKVYEFWTKTSGSLVYARYLGIYDTSAPSSTGNSTLSTSSLSVTGTATIANTVTLSKSAGTSLDVKGDSVFAKNVVIEGDLTITGDLNKTIANATIADLGAIGDVDISEPRQGDTIRYDEDTQRWTNQATANVVRYLVDLVDNGDPSNSQLVFQLNGSRLQDHLGTQTTLVFESDTTYRFEWAPSVANGSFSVVNRAIKFARKPDINPTGYTSPDLYDDNSVSYVGALGVPGSYTQIIVDKDTPSPLYLYLSGEATDLFGAAYPISVNNGSVKVVNKKYQSIGNQIIYVDTSVNEEDITIILPAKQNTSPGMFVTVVDSGSASINNIIIDRNGINNSINGINENKIINIDYHSLTLVADGNGRWSIDDPLSDGGTVLKTTESTNAGTGALQIKGGLGVFGNVNLGGNLSVGEEVTFNAKIGSGTIQQPSVSGSSKDFNLNDFSNRELRYNIESLNDSWRPSGGQLPASDTPEFKVRVNVVTRTNNIVTISFKNIVTGAAYSFLSNLNDSITFRKVNTGNLKVTGKTLLSVADPSQATVIGTEDIIDLTKSAYYANPGPKNVSLQAGVNGQVFYIARKGSGILTVTVANAAWRNGDQGLMILDEPGHAVTMMYMQNEWFCVGNNGARFGAVGEEQSLKAPHSLEDLSSVEVTTPVTIGQVLKWNGTKWTNGVDSGSTLNSLTDVNITNPSNGQVLKWNSASSRWINNQDDT